MIIDKIKTPDGIKLLSALPADYVEWLSLNIPERIKKLIADVRTVFLTKINVDREEIEDIVQKIEKKGSRKCLRYKIMTCRNQGALLKTKVKSKLR